MLVGSFAQRICQAESDRADPESLRQLLGKGCAKRGVFEGNVQEGYMEAGEVAGDIADIPSAAEIVNRI